MYSREIDGREVSFGVSGKLWHGVLVMFDRETGSLWTQISGRAIQGEQLGAKLEHRHSEFTTWSIWKAAHPETLVLQKDDEAREREGSHYADYLADKNALYMDELAEDLGGVEPKDLVFGVSVDGATLAVTERLLAQDRIVNAVIGTTPVALLFDPATGFVQAVERRLDGRVLLLAPEPGQDPRVLFRDVLTDERHGPDELAQLRVDRAFWYAWSRSNPGSRVIAD